MRRPRTRLWVFCALIATAGCGFSSSIRILQTPNAAEPLDRIYALVYQGQLDRNHAEKLRAALVATMQPRTTAFRVMVITGLELDDSQIRADMEAFRPAGILMMKPTGGLLAPVGGTYNVTYLATVLEPRSGRVLWRAKLRNEGAPVMLGARMELSARDLARHLTRIHLLREKQDDELMNEVVFE
jgi:hypothetical protein